MKNFNIFGIHGKIRVSGGGGEVDSPMHTVIFSANQWSGFYMIGTSVIKGLMLRVNESYKLELHFFNFGIIKVSP